MDATGGPPTGRVVRRRRRAAAPALVAGLAVLAGCTSAPQVDAPWVEPDWMADQAQQVEQFVLDLQGCVEASGWNVTVDEYAGVDEPFSSQEEAERFRTDADACLLALGHDPSSFDGEPTVADLQRSYEHEVDVHRCLVHQGVEMSEEPPGEDRFVEQRLRPGSDDEAWWAYGDPAVLALDAAELARVRQSCPEPWVFAGR